MTESLELSIELPAAPEQIFRAWLDSRAHGLFTGSRAQIDPQVGGKFTAWDGYIQGQTLELVPFERILQSWRTSDFPPEMPDSLLEVRLEDAAGGTYLTLVHTGIPDEQATGYEQGWRDYYFAPMQDYFGHAAG